MLERLIKRRRDLHRIPEVDFDLPKTRAYILETLQRMPCEITLIGRASLCAFFDADRAETFAFRSDMDALPITERNDVDFISQHEGKMHACGHDGHMSILLTFAEEISKLILNQTAESTDESDPARPKQAHEEFLSHTSPLPHNVLLVFQAAEETTGGAKEICESGIFERYNVKKIFGLHLWPDYPEGSVICRKNEFMARTCNLEIKIRGKSSHAAKSELGVDALFSGVRFVNSAYAMERSELPENVFRLLKFGIFQSGTATNIISDYTSIRGSIRCFQDEIFDFMSNRLRAIAKEIEEDSGCSMEFTFMEGYPALINEEDIFRDFKKALTADVANNPGFRELAFAAPHKRFSLIEPVLPNMTAEDFSFYQKRLPGLFFYLGTGMVQPLHSDRFNFNESVLPAGVEIYTRLLFLCGQI